MDKLPEVFLNLTCRKALEDFYISDTKTGESLQKLFDRYVNEQHLPAETNYGTFCCKMVTIKKKYDILKKSKNRSQAEASKLTEFLDSVFPLAIRENKPVLLTELVHNLRNENSCLLDEINTKNECITNLKLEMEVLNNKLDKNSNILEQCCKDNYDLENSLDYTSNKLKSLNLVIDSLKDEIKYKDITIEKLKASQINLTENLKASSTEVLVLQDKLTDSSKKVKHLVVESVKQKGENHLESAWKSLPNFFNDHSRRKEIENQVPKTIERY